MVDRKAFQKMAVFLGNFGIEISGVILDRGFCSHDVPYHSDAGKMWVLLCGNAQI